MLNPVTLEGDYVRLEPLTSDHLDAFCEVGLDPSLWTWITHPVRNREDFAAYIAAALDGQEQGDLLPFATVEQSSGTVVGSTRYGAINMSHKRLEIGWTWIAPPWQRTALNTEAKILMLRHAFDTLGCNRVEWKTDALNERSRNSILRLGAKAEGIHRSHMQAEDGRLRDTAYFSMIRSEWPAAEKRLLEKLSR